MLDICILPKIKIVQDVFYAGYYLLSGGRIVQREMSLDGESCVGGTAALEYSNV